MKCETVSCEKEAVSRVFWPGQTRDMCATCAVKALNMCHVCRSNDTPVTTDRRGTIYCFECLMNALDELHKLRSFKRGVDDALNSGNGVYRP